MLNKKIEFKIVFSKNITRMALLPNSSFDLEDLFEDYTDYQSYSDLTIESNDDHKLYYFKREISEKCSPIRSLLIDNGQLQTIKLDYDRETINIVLNIMKKTYSDYQIKNCELFREKFPNLFEFYKQYNPSGLHYIIYTLFDDPNCFLKNANYIFRETDEFILYFSNTEFDYYNFTPENIGHLDFEVVKELALHHWKVVRPWFEANKDHPNIEMFCENLVNELEIIEYSEVVEFAKLSELLPEKYKNIIEKNIIRVLREQ